MNIKKVALIALTFTIGACQNDSASTEAARNDANELADNSEANMADTAAAKVDAAFLTEAMKGDNGEVAIGNLAAAQASSDAAKDFGRCWPQITALTKASSHHWLHRLVASSDELTDEGKANLEKLKGLKGAAFDPEFARMMVEDHKKDIAKYENQASAGDPATAALAKETLPTLRKHLQTAEAL